MSLRRGAAFFLAVALLLPSLAMGEVLIHPDEFEELYGPYCRLEGDTLILNEGVTALGEYTGEMAWEDDKRWHWIKDEAKKDLFTDSFRGFTGEDVVFHRIQWPSTIRYLGGSSFHVLHFDVFTLPATVEAVFSDAFVYCGFSVFRIEAEVPWEQIRDSLYDCAVYAWDVPEGHPLFKAVDGVLFTKDGKTLLSYPNARTDAHYDVPRGVERIAERAFSNEYLQTVSLPIGLKAVEDCAFAGCGRLHAIAVPLTVTELGRRIFADCVSLDLVSLPEGLKADKSQYDMYYENDGLYHGDNGGTEKKEEEERRHYFEWDEYDDIYEPARLTNGGQDITVYADWEGDQAMGALPEGMIVLAEESRESRCRVCEVGDMEKSSILGWVDTAQVRIIANETLFSYAAARPPLALLGDGATESPLLANNGWNFTLWGPLIAFDFYDVEDVAADGVVCLLWEAEMYRRADGPEGNLGYVYDSDPYALISVLQSPAGEAAACVYPGTQVRVLETCGGWARVTTGFDEGWVRENQVMTVPVLPEDIR